MRRHHEKMPARIVATKRMVNTTFTLPNNQHTISEIIVKGITCVRYFNDVNNFGQNGDGNSKSIVRAIRR